MVRKARTGFGLWLGVTSLVVLYRPRSTVAACLELSTCASLVATSRALARDRVMG